MEKIYLDYNDELEKFMLNLSTCASCNLALSNKIWFHKTGYNG